MVAVRIKSIPASAKQYRSNSNKNAVSFRSPREPSTALNTKKGGSNLGAARNKTHGYLKLNLQFELQHAPGYRGPLEVSIRAARRGYGALNMPEGTSIGQIIVGVREAWMVEHVVRVSAHAKRQPAFGNPEVLLDGHIHVEVSRPMELIPRGVPEGAKVIQCRWVLAELAAVQTSNVHLATWD